ncbi:MAG TPA: VOC family protein [Gemmataceae bacterium]|nr:VOC family protein [Gemmataceae bacterium]
MSKVRYIPEGYHTITPSLVIHGAAAAIDFYKKVLGAKEVMRMAMGGNKIGHAELQIGTSKLMLADDFPEMGACSPPVGSNSPVTIFLYVEDCDKTFNTAVAAGAKALMPPADMFWGDRFCKFQDPFGHNWAAATHIEDVPPEEMPKRQAAAMAAMGHK